MRYGFLSDHFTGVAAKRLTAVEADIAVSRQHEFNGVAALRRLLGDAKIERRQSRFIRLDGVNESISDDAPVTWYDARERHPTRTEWRLYFKSNAVMELADAGDLLVVARRPDGDILFLVAARGSTIENQIAWLFGLDRDMSVEFHYEGFEGGHDRGLDFVDNHILEEIGIEPEEPEAERLDRVLEPLGLTFPTTRIMSELARTTLDGPDPRDDPDAALLAWVEYEEALFRRLERRIVAERLSAGFVENGAADVDGFLQFSLSVQNRRKSRMGLSLENHVEAALEALDIRFARGAATEGRSKPDFLFPGADEYANARFDDRRLTMLGVKSTVKDRWRQVLAEAARIPRKHLLTLEPGISRHQTDEMTGHFLQLVAPRGLHGTFAPDQAAWLMDFRGFADLVLARQAAG